MRRNRKIRKMEPWYRRLFERIKENRNRDKKGKKEQQGNYRTKDSGESLYQPGV